MGFLLFFILFISLILFFGLSIVGTIVRAILSAFGFGARRNDTTRRRDEQRAASPSDNTDKQSPTAHKIFGKDDGEYVDFEEIREE
jgi:hypothetical protein